jgi:hypothetical protein
MASFNIVYGRIWRFEKQLDMKMARRGPTLETDKHFVWKF